MWKADIRWHDSEREGRLTDRTLTSSPTVAVAAFRALLARDDLIGQPCAARLVSPIVRGAIYYSRFDREPWEGRMLPDAEIDPMRAERAR